MRVPISSVTQISDNRTPHRSSQIPILQMGNRQAQFAIPVTEWQQETNTGFLCSVMSGPILAVPSPPPVLQAHPALPYCFQALA